ncbi:MAG: hypothetical protein JST81_14685 [Bacteroidetes bacterium]|nr:hypothetical protein [Bacteroidota bacterium]
MKRILTCQLFCIALLMLACNTMYAQQSTAFERALQSSYTSLVPLKKKKDEVAVKKQADKLHPAIQQATDELSTETKKSLTGFAQKSEQVNKAIQQNYVPKKTTIDLVSDLSAAPAPLTSPVTAVKTDIDKMYQSFYDLLGRRKDQLTALDNKYNPYKQTYNKEGKAGLEKQAVAEADKNALVREMGGAEQLKNMSDAERRQAAERMKASIQQNPGMLVSKSPDAGINSLQQKIMSDPAYAKKFSAMTEAEKEAEMKKYITTKPQQGTANREYIKSSDQVRAERTIEINALIDRTRKRIEAATAIYTDMLNTVTKLTDAYKGQLEQWVKSTTHTIPMVELGEYGHDHDPEMMSAMEDTRKLAYYSIAKKEAELRSICWIQYKNAVAAAMIEFNNYADGYAWGQENNDRIFNGTYNDPVIISTYAWYYDMISEIAKTSQNISKDSKAAQQAIESLL